MSNSGEGEASPRAAKSAEEEQHALSSRAAKSAEKGKKKEVSSSSRASKAAKGKKEASPRASKAAQEEREEAFSRAAEKEDEDVLSRAEKAAEDLYHLRETYFPSEPDDKTSKLQRESDLILELLDSTPQGSFLELRVLLNISCLHERPSF